MSGTVSPADNCWLGGGEERGEGERGGGRGRGEGGGGEGRGERGGGVRLRVSGGDDENSPHYLIACHGSCPPVGQGQILTLLL